MRLLRQRRSREASPEVQVLLAVVRGIARPTEPSGLDVALRDVSDWSALMDSALRHGLVAQLHAALEVAPEAARALVPAQTRARLRSLAGGIAIRSLRMSRQLLQLLERLQAAGVPALALKGPALSHLAYGEPTLRDSVDLDVLVRPSDIHAAQAVLENAGLVADESMAGIPWETVEAAEQEKVLTHPTTRLIVELHWRLGPRFAPDSLLADELLARAGQIELLGRVTPTMSRPDSVLALTVHASTHEWNRLEDVATLCALLRSFTHDDWRALSTLAAEHDCRRRLAVGLRLARDLGGLDAAGLRAGVATQPAADRLAKEAEALLLSPEPRWWSSGSRSGRAAGVLWQARVLDTRRAAARHLWSRLVTSGARDWAITGDAAPSRLPGPFAQLARRQRRLWSK